MWEAIEVECGHPQFNKWRSTLKPQKQSPPTPETMLQRPAWGEGRLINGLNDERSRREALTHIYWY